MFRRKSKDEDVQLTPAAPAGPGQPKGAPTPTRKEAEAARKARLTGVPSDPREAKKAARDADRQARYEQRLALQSGDPNKLPPRDRGPVKAYVRDYVDGRRSAGELFIPVAVVVLVAGFVRILWVQTVLLYSWSVMLAAVVLDSLWIVLQLRKRLPAQFPTEDRRGAILYGVMRSVQLRRLRLPKPKVKPGGAPVTPAS